MATVHTIDVSNISPTTTREQLYDFFAFCGRITDVTLTEATEGKTKTATVSFEKPTAAKTACMLNGGTLDGNNIVVTSEKEHVDEPISSGTHPIDQTDKPRAGIAAEYLAKGYVLSDSILQRAIDMDQKQGISTRFLSYLNQLDTEAGKRVLKPGAEGTPHPKVSEKVLETAKTMDEQHQITKTASDVSSTGSAYYSKALATPFGKQIFSFYSSTSKQVLDIHAEARRMADIHKASAPTTANPGPVLSAKVAEQPIESTSDKKLD
ncbi:hypothetical protein DL93DRAFT_2230962 [Clavulina sp. PMI_390]|nr:hypothetical protein DL93DRAFT_2230962 [Clavulina sp. PMI_390]